MSEPENTEPPVQAPPADRPDNADDRPPAEDPDGDVTAAESDPNVDDDGE